MIASLRSLRLGPTAEVKADGGGFGLYVNAQPVDLSAGDFPVAVLVERVP